MKEKIFAALKQEHKNLGFSEKALQGLAESLELTGLVTDENLDLIVKGQKPALAALQSEIDGRVRSAIEKVKGDEAKEKEKKSETIDQKEKPTETPDQKDLRELKEKFAAIESSKLNSELTSKATKKLKEMQVPDKAINLALQGKVFKDDAEIETFATATETAYKEMIQELTDKGLNFDTRPHSSSATGEKAIDEQIKGWAAKDAKQEKK